MVKSDIGIQQNSMHQLDKLAAASFYYRRAKFFLGLQFLLTVPAALAIAVIIFNYPEAKIWTTFYALTVALLDTLLLERIQVFYKKLGARIQESFDLDLFGIPWNKLRTGGLKPDSEDIIQAAIAFKGKFMIDKLRDWYPPAVSQLSLPLARLVCQRANTWWDANLRKKYAAALISILAMIIVSVFTVSLFAGHTVEEMILSVYVPVAPSILWGVREIRRQYEASESLDKLRSHVEQVWSDTISGKISDSELITISREIQDSIFDGRLRNPLIFDWINQLVRPTQQISMNAKACELVREVQNESNR